jgi:hypothetical protein
MYTPPCKMHRGCIYGVSYRMGGVCIQMVALERNSSADTVYDASPTPFPTGTLLLCTRTPLNPCRRQWWR